MSLLFNPRLCLVWLWLLPPALSAAAVSHARFVWHGDVPASAKSRAAQLVRDAASRLHGWLEDEMPLPTLEVHLYATAEAKLMATDDARAAHADSTRVHAIAEAPFLDALPRACVAAWLHATLGRAPTPALAGGLATLIADYPAQPHLWAARMQAAHVLWPLSDLLDAEQWAMHADCCGAIQAASFVAAMAQCYGKDELRRRYTEWQPLPGEVARLESEWHEWLALLPAAAPPRPPEPRQPLLGFNLAHQGYRVHNGYAGEATHAAIARLHGLGATAVAIVPYTFMRDAALAAPLPVPRRAGPENDVSVVHAAEAARQAGLSVVLKPHIWVGHGSWPGDIAMASEAEWDHFFQYYRRWIAHYALLAARHGWEVYCIGTELVQATRHRPEAWRQLCHDLRHLYGGRLTYAANWGEEFEQLAFADALDYVGIDCYYPLAADSNATDEALRQGMAQIVARLAAVHQRTRKPILITETGFRSVPAPWIEPHGGIPRAPCYEADQARCYRIALDMLADQPWLAGVLFWKYPSSLEIARHRNGGFNPAFKPAEAEAARAFRQWPAPARKRR